MAQVMAVAAVAAVVAAVVRRVVTASCENVGPYRRCGRQWRHSLSLRLSSVTQDSVSAGLSEGML